MKCRYLVALKQRLDEGKSIDDAVPYDIPNLDDETLIEILHLFSVYSEIPKRREYAKNKIREIELKCMQDSD